MPEKDNPSYRKKKVLRSKARLVYALLIIAAFFSIYGAKEVWRTRKDFGSHQGNVNATKKRIAATHPAPNEAPNLLFDSNVVDANDGNSASILDLLPWERESMFANGTSSYLKAGVNTPQTCSLGTIARLGTLVPQDTCGGGLATYGFVRQKLQSEMFGRHGGGFEGREDDGVCDVCRILDILASRNLSTVSFWGDSVQNQVFDGLVCEMARRNVTIVNDETLSTGCGGMMCVQSVRTVMLRHREGGTDDNEPRNAVLKFFFNYKPNCEVDHIAKKHDTDVLVLNSGVHYPPQNIEKYREHLSCLMTNLKPFLASGNISLFAFRETGAQHFNSSGGEYQGRVSNDCVPIRIEDDDERVFGWRDREFTKAARQVGYRVHIANASSTPDEIKKYADTDANKVSTTSSDEVFILPFLKFSSNFYQLHPSNGNDCTHYCSTPYLWYPIWRSLRLSLEVKFGAK